MFFRLKTACFTGHRFLPKGKIPEIKNRLLETLEKLIESGVIFYGCGGAIGFDMLAGFTVLEMKTRYPQIRLIMVLPCRDQDSRWADEQKTKYRQLLEEADKVKYLADRYYDGCMLDRNRHLVAHSSHCVAYLTQNHGGAFFTVKLAQKKGLAIYNLANMHEQHMK